MPGSNMAVPSSKTSPDPSLAVCGLALHKEAAQLGPITFKLPGPGCWWLTGRSGAGKSLLLESLAGFHAQAIGSVRVNLGAPSDELGDLAPERRSIALMPQRWRLFPHWNATRNLRFVAEMSKTPQARIAELAERLQVARLLDRPTSALSGGETQRLVLIQTLISPARVLLLDEPSPPSVLRCSPLSLIYLRKNPRRSDASSSSLHTVPQRSIRCMGHFS